MWIGGSADEHLMKGERGSKRDGQGRVGWREKIKLRRRFIGQKNAEIKEEYEKKPRRKTAKNGQGNKRRKNEEKMQ